VSIFDRPYYESLFGGREIQGEFAIDWMDDFIEFEKLYLTVSAEIKNELVATFPVQTIALIYKDGKFEDEDFARWCSKHNMKWADSNFFVSEDSAVLSNCCRLLSDSTKFTGFINSLGSGGLEIGSIKVATQDLYHIALESRFDREKFFELLKEKTILNCKFLDVQRHTIKRNIEKGLLPNYGPGGVNFDRQFSTIGILGLYEVLEGFGLIREDEFGYHYYTPEADKMADDILDTINQIKDTFPVDYNFNIEAIPGERAAVILAQKSKLIYGSKWDILGNQWIPLSVKCTMNEKIRVSARLDKGVGGGVISHYNAEAPFVSEDQAWDLLNHIARNGVIYFAFNYKINECKNHHLFLGTDICPQCGNGVYDTAQRIVGFIELKRYYSKERKAEFDTRQWFNYSQQKFE